MIECPNCHSQLEEESSFCPNCGYKLKSEVQTSAGANHSRKKPVIIIAVIVVLVMAFWAVNELILKPGRVYEDAVAAIDEGNYEEALELLSEISDFSDTPIALTAIYDDALEMMDHGYLTEAYSLFSELAELNFEDSAAQMEQTEVLLVDEQLQGVWTRSLEEGAGLYYGFDDGYFESMASVAGMTLPGEQGTYTIDDGIIAISVSGGVSKQYYLLEDGRLHLYLADPVEHEDDATEYELVKVE